MPLNQKVSHCPNCGLPASREGNEITCANCDAVFTVSKKQGATVKKVGRIEKIESRLDALEQLVGPAEPEPGPEPNVNEDDEEDLL